MVLNWLRRAHEDAVSTRLCDLPWSRFSVDTTTEPPAWSPCRNHEIAGDARDLASVDERLRGLRRNLLDGSPRGACKKCPDKPRASPRQLKEHLAVEGVAEGNLLIEAVREVIDEPPVMPPAELMYRVAHTRDAIDFALSGTVSFFDFTPLIDRYDRASQPRVLDWDCGSGRLSIPLAARRPDLALTGCDIDAEAVQWCRDNIAGGDFHVIDPLPPTSFTRGEFTSIVGYSVITHLSRELQFAWRDELHALLADGGIAMVTTMGESAARRHGLEERLKREGIIDDLLDSTLDDVAADGYYRSTFQSRAFTEAAWGERFDVLEVIEAGAFNYQDIVVLRKRA